uniref:SPRY-associated domain-containing protein n=1 Tax=Salmo trutta TaxID=8032 RepID=A0A674BHI2_SALTR
SALQTPNSPLRELDLSNNDLGDRGVKLLCVGLTSPLCNIQTLCLYICSNYLLLCFTFFLEHLGKYCIDISPLSRLDGCKITYESCETLASALQTPNSPLRELDLSYNDLGDRGVELLCVGLASPLRNIQTLGLGQCGLTEGCCSDLASVLSSPNSQLKQLELRDNDLQDSGLDLSYNHPGDSAGGLLSAALVDPTYKLMKLK